MDNFILTQQVHSSLQKELVDQLTLTKLTMSIFFNGFMILG